MEGKLQVFRGSEIYVKWLESFSDYKKIEVDFTKNDISISMYVDFCKMKHACWMMKVKFNRHKRHTLSEYFQDLVAFYLNVCLPPGYTIELEKKEAKTQPDIVIKKEGKYIFVIEIKTTIGWNRPEKQEEYFEELRLRVCSLSKNFKIPVENVLYVFEDPGNVGKLFLEKFWDKKRNLPMPAPTEFPFSIIKPLFYANDPSYWPSAKKIDKKKQYNPFVEEEVYKWASANIVTRFEDIVAQVISAKHTSD